MVRDFFSKLLRREISSFVRISVTVAPLYPGRRKAIRPWPFDLVSSRRRSRRHTLHRDHEIRPAMWLGQISLDYGRQLHAVMHLQIVEADGQLTRRYVANGPHRSAGGTDQRAGMLSSQLFGPGGDPTPEYIGSVGGEYGPL